MSVNGGVWVTVKGTHIFIKDNETFDEAVSRLKSYKENHKEMSAADAIREYQNYSYQPLNEALRKGEKLDGKLADIDRAMQKEMKEGSYDRFVNRFTGCAVSAELIEKTGLSSWLKENVKTDSLMEAWEDTKIREKLKESFIGQTFVEKGYSSTSSSNDSFNDFALGNGNFNYFSSFGFNDSMIINLPSKIKRIDLGESGYIAGSNENEVIINKGTKYKVKDLYYDYPTGSLKFYVEAY